MNNNSNSNDDDKIARLEEQLARLVEQVGQLQNAMGEAQETADRAQAAMGEAQETADRAQKAADRAQKAADRAQKVGTGEYWTCIRDVFGSMLQDFDGAFNRYKNLRRSSSPRHYHKLKDFFLQGDHEGIEAYLVDEPELYSCADSVVTFEPELYSCADSVVTFDTSEDVKQPGGTEGTKNHQKKYLKTIQGEMIKSTNKSKAHLIPDAELCNEFWLPELKLILGTSDESTEYPKEAMSGAARLHTNKLVFGMEHNHYFDDLQYGNILAIPLFQGMGEVGSWQYQQAYEMLIVCDTSKTYKILGISGNEEHVEDASVADINKAAFLLQQATIFLADSLQTNWDSFYNAAGSEDGESKKRKKMLEKMLMELDQGQVIVPVPKIEFDDDDHPKVYKVQFGVLFDSDEAKKYIPDPLLLLIKAAVNLSAHHYNGKCKLLPACKSLSSKESSVGEEGSEGPVNIVTAVPEIGVVSDDETSVCSDLTSYYEDDPCRLLVTP